MARQEGQVVYITFDEAKQLIPIFQELKRIGPWKEARESAMRLEQEMKMVRGDIEYKPFGGKQMFLNSTDHNFLMDVMSAQELR
ncbi:hypothetical protein LCGC14_1127750 [marine sediment metagenome]|uniref:Uncharacterized protein n=1 Tax=marine sediment metagenome TaxID=412755 RepID=A0A0F9M6V9_9ZZZZ